jgi:phage host-nuclease inhibitor protein Gam
VAAIEARRQAMLGKVNAAADAKVAPIVAELAGLEAAIATWWMGKGHALLPKGRKTMQLGGCTIGTVAGRAKLGHRFDKDDEAVAALLGSRYATQTTHVRYSIDRAATLKLLQAGGAKGTAIAALGFRIDGGERFVLTPVEQGGTVGS